MDDSLDIFDLLTGMGQDKYQIEDDSQECITSPQNYEKDEYTEPYAIIIEEECEKVSSPLSIVSTEDEDEVGGVAKFTKVFDKSAVSASHFHLPALSEELDPQCAHVTMEPIPGVEAWIFDNVFSPDECTLLRERAETAGFTYWDMDQKCGERDDFRTAFTVETHVEDLAALTFQRIGHFMKPLTIDENCDIEGEWFPCGVNPHWLFSRYIDGGHFSPHTDGNTVFDFNKRTMYTALVYLSSSEDGETRIFDDQQMNEPFTLIDGKLRGNPDLVLGNVKPRIGRVLVFYHRLMHEGNPAQYKYIIRTDITYERQPRICDEPHDRVAFELYMKAQELSEKGECHEAMILFRRAFKMSSALAKVYGQ